MDISAFSSGASESALSGQKSTSASKKAADSRGLNKALNQSAIVSGLLPAVSSSGSRGSGGLSSDIYTAVGMQTQGMMSRGLTGIRIANISLGIDMSQAAKDARDQDAAGPKEADNAAATDSAGKTAENATEKPPVDEAAHAERVLDGMMDEETPAATRHYSSPDLSNPALGGLLNSLG
jgi:hypothetical protein